MTTSIVAFSVKMVRSAEYYSAHMKNGTKNWQNSKFTSFEQLHNIYFLGSICM